MKYRVVVREVVVTAYEFEADSESAARQCAIDAVGSVDVVSTDVIEAELVSVEPAA